MTNSLKQLQICGYDKSISQGNSTVLSAKMNKEQISETVTQATSYCALEKKVLIETYNVNNNTVQLLQQLSCTIKTNL